MSQKTSSCVSSFARWSAQDIYDDRYYDRVRRAAESSLRSLLKTLESGKNKNWDCAQTANEIHRLDRIAGQLHGAQDLAYMSGDMDLYQDIEIEKNAFEKTLAKFRKAMTGECMTSWELRNTKKSGVSGLKKKTPTKKTTCRLTTKKVGGRLKLVTVCSAAPKRKPAKRKAKR